MVGNMWFPAPCWNQDTCTEFENTEAAILDCCAKPVGCSPNCPCKAHSLDSSLCHEATLAVMTFSLGFFPMCLFSSKWKLKHTSTQMWLWKLIASAKEAICTQKLAAWTKKKNKTIMSTKTVLCVRHQGVREKKSISCSELMLMAKRSC